MPQRPSAQERSRALLFVLIVLFWIMSGSDTPSLVSDPDARASRRDTQDAGFPVLNSSGWGDFKPLREDGISENSTTRGIYLNLPGFRRDDGLAWDKLELFRTRCRQLTNNAKLVRDGQDLGNILVEPIWQNATGMVRGPWVRSESSSVRFPTDYNLTALAPHTDWIHQHRRWSWNLTGAEGSMVMRFIDSDMSNEVDCKSEWGGLLPGGRARRIRATLGVEDSFGSGSSFDMNLHGVHWVREGTILMTTTSSKFAGIFALPHLVPHANLFEPSRTLLNQTLWQTAEGNAKDMGDPFLWQLSAPVGGEDDFWRTRPHCEYLVYLQIHSIPPRQLGVSSVTPDESGVASVINVIESELSNPRGAPVPRLPSYQLSGIVFSPDCGFILDTKGPPASASGHHLVGFKDDIHYKNITRWFFAMALTYLGQFYIIKAQVKQSLTPSTMDRVSVWTLLIMTFADTMVFTSVAALSLSATRIYLACLVLLFPTLISALVLGHFLSDVYKTQEPERRRLFQERLANSLEAPYPPSSILPRPPTDPTPRRPPSSRSARAVVPSNQDVSAGTQGRGDTANSSPEYVDTPFSTLMSWCMLASTVILFLSLAATGWYPRLRSMYANLVLFSYLSFWLPQIYRNIMRNCRQALSWHFMIGQSVLRLLPIAYFYLYPANVILCRVEPSAFVLMVGWMWVQLCILGFQDLFQPRLFLPESWTPEAWDYHRVLSEGDDIEGGGGLPIGLTCSPRPGGLERVKSADAKKSAAGKNRMRTVDCSICFEPLEVPVIKAGEDDPSITGVTGMFVRRQYMVTPCRHIFHRHCLEGWMRFRLQCPICREEIPPL